MLRAASVLILGLALVGAGVPAAENHAGHEGAAGRCADPEAPATLECALAPIAAFDESGRLWVVWAFGGHLYVSRSTDEGEHFDAPMLVNRAPERIAADGENRPKVVVYRDTIYVSWTQRLGKPYTGHIRFSRSLDGGRSFSEPMTVNDHLGITSHRFESMAVNGRGELFIAWLDKRDRVAAEETGGAYHGAALYYTTSPDGGQHFQTNQKIADHTCECCRTAMALGPDGRPVIAWRHIFGTNIRDHALVELTAEGIGPIRRFSFDEWAIDACPHHGPAIDIDPKGAYHLAWFNNAPQRHGLFYANSGDGGASFSRPLPFGRYDAAAAHPDVLVFGDRVYLAWKEFDGVMETAFVMVSRDGGRTWDEPHAVAHTSEATDHPFLLTNGKQAYLSWHHRGDPFRPVPLDATGAQRARPQ